MKVQWYLSSYLESHSLTTYRLMEHSGLSSNTVYPMTRNEAKRVSTEVLTRVIESLRDLTGKSTQVDDILRYE